MYIKREKHYLYYFLLKGSIQVPLKRLGQNPGDTLFSPFFFIGLII